jgi:hypothetical protein
MRAWLLIAAGALLLGACTTQRRLHSLPVESRQWLTAVSFAQRAAWSGKYGDADRALTDYAEHFANTMEAHESLYWRALFQLDPANTASSPRAAVQLLDQYLRDSASTAPHLDEAQTLRRLALTIDSLTQTVTAAAAAQRAADSAHAADSAQQATDKDALMKENQKLKDQFAQATAELDRIKKRLASPKP